MTTPETRDLIARVRAGIAPADQPQALRDLARTADGPPLVDAGMLRREADGIEGVSPSYREHLRVTGETAPTVVSDEEEALRARVAELEEQVKEAVVRLARVPDMLDRERREGAEAMRERAAAHLDMLAGCASLLMSPQQTRREAAASIRALPLDDDAREGAQGDDNGR